MLTTGGTGEKAGCFVFHGFVLEWELRPGGSLSGDTHPHPGRFAKRGWNCNTVGQDHFSGDMARWLAHATGPGLAKQRRRRVKPLILGHSALARSSRDDRWKALRGCVWA